MSDSIFDGIWGFARSLTVFSPDGAEKRAFLGFLEPLSFTSSEGEKRKKPFVLPCEKFRLIAEPAEDFFDGSAVLVACGAEAFEVLAVKPVYVGEEITHRECVLVKSGEVIDCD